MLIFVNLNVSLKDGAKHTDLYIKPTDDHQHLNCQSSHPHHIKVSIPYSQALRVSRICSPEKDFRVHICKMKEWFLARGYPEKDVNDQIDKFVFGKNLLIKKLIRKWYSFYGYISPES